MVSFHDVNEMKLGPYASTTLNNRLAEQFGPKGLPKLMSEGFRAVCRRYGMLQFLVATALDRPEANVGIMFVEVVVSPKIEAILDLEFAQVTMETRSHIKKHILHECRCNDFVQEAALEPREEAASARRR